MVSKIRDWEAALVDVETDLQRQCWKSGEHDCAQVSFAVVKAVTGIDLSGSFVYETEGEARNLIVSGGGLLFQASRVADLLGWKKTDRDHLHRGDPILVRVDGTAALGFVSSCGRPMVATQQGLVFITLKQVVCGWAIPCHK